MDLRGSRTEANLLAAFAGESQARNKYTYFAGTAKKEGYEQIAQIFYETAENERAHAKIYFKLLGLLGSTSDNLQAAAHGEHYEWSEMYAGFEKEARAEGFHEIANIFANVAQVEHFHEQRFLQLRTNIEQQATFRRDQPQRWQCRNCGYIHEGAEAPDVCPACAHPQGFFELLATNY